MKTLRTVLTVLAMAANPLLADYYSSATLGGSAQPSPPAAPTSFTYLGDHWQRHPRTHYPPGMDV